MTVAFFVGVPGCGKTTAAITAAIERANKRDVPILLVDSEGVVPSSLFPAPRVNLSDMIAKCWDEETHASIVPSGPDEAENIFLAARAGGNIVLVIDEISYWGRGVGCLPSLSRLFRVHRHSAVDIYATTQYPADMAPVLWNCKDEVRVYRNETPGALKRLADECGFDDGTLDKIRALPRYESVPWKRSF